MTPLRLLWAAVLLLPTVGCGPQHPGHPLPREWPAFAAFAPAGRPLIVVTDSLTAAPDSVFPVVVADGHLDIDTALVFNARPGDQPFRALVLVTGRREVFSLTQFYSDSAALYAVRDLVTARFGRPEGPDTGWPTWTDPAQTLEVTIHWSSATNDGQVRVSHWHVGHPEAARMRAAMHWRFCLEAAPLLCPGTR